MERYQTLVYSVCFNLLHNHPQAQDVSQEVFLQVFHSAAKFRFESQVSSWLYRISVNRSLNLIRANRRIERLQRIGVLESERGERQDFSGNIGINPPDRTFEENRRRKILLNAIDTLPFKQRVPLILNRLQGFTSQEIAEILNISQATVEARLRRAKENLKNKLLQVLP